MGSPLSDSVGGYEWNCLKHVGDSRFSPEPFGLFSPICLRAQEEGCPGAVCCCSVFPLAKRRCYGLCPFVSGCFLNVLFTRRSAFRR